MYLRLKNYNFQTRADITVFDVNTAGQPDPADLNKLTIQFQAVLCDLPEVTSGSFSSLFACRRVQVFLTGSVLDPF